MSSHQTGLAVSLLVASSVALAIVGGTLPAQTPTLVKDLDTAITLALPHIVEAVALCGHRLGDLDVQRARA